MKRTILRTLPAPAALAALALAGSALATSAPAGAAGPDAVRHVVVTPRGYTISGPDTYRPGPVTFQVTTAAASRSSTCSASGPATRSPT